MKRNESKKPIIEPIKPVNNFTDIEQRYKLLFENLRLAIIYYDTTWKGVLLNRQAAGILGGKTREFIGKSIYGLFPGVADLYVQRFLKIRKNGSGTRFEHPLEITGKKKWLVSDIRAVIDSNGNISGIQCISDDITKHKQIEDNLKVSEKKYRNLVEALPVGVAMVTIEGHPIEQNGVLSKMYGHKAKKEP